MAAKKKAKTTKKKKAKARAAKKPSAKKSSKTSKKTAKKPAKKAAPKKAKKPVKAAAKKAPARKAAKKTGGEGDYAASRAFLKDEASFVEKNKAKIPAMGKAAEKALDGPEGASLREAEATAAARSRDIF